MKTIVSKNYEGDEMLLVNKKTGRPLSIGARVTDFRGDPMRLLGGAAPHKPESTGRIYVISDGVEHSFYPGVIDAEWRPK
jgi:hypothetical protein